MQYSELFFMNVNQAKMIESLLAGSTKKVLKFEGTATPTGKKEDNN
jgi:hypothetical protein